MKSTSQAPSDLSSSSSSSASSTQHQLWIEAQDELKQKLITEDDFPWRLNGPTTRDQHEEHVLKYVAGVDISYAKQEHPSSMACGSLVVLDIHSLKVVYEDHSFVNLAVPYVPGFLAFREAPVLLELLERMRDGANLFYPQLLMVDGNGILHPRGFGLACHLGILANIPAIGIGKNLHHVDGLTLSGVKQLLEAKENCAEDIVTLTGCSGRIWGVAMRSTDGCVKPIYISVGHRISLDTAIKIVKQTCKYRVPEPIRQEPATLLLQQLKQIYWSSMLIEEDAHKISDRWSFKVSNCLRTRRNTAQPKCSFIFTDISKVVPENIRFYLKSSTAETCAIVTA